jgi:hypothetical protein
MMKERREQKWNRRAGPDWRGRKTAWTAQMGFSVRIGWFNYVHDVVYCGARKFN